MRTKTVYIIENEDVEILRKANELVRVVYEQPDVEYECMEDDVDGAIYDLADFCYEQIDLDDYDEEYLDDYDGEYFDDYEEDEIEDDEEEEVEGE